MFPKDQIYKIASIRTMSNDEPLNGKTCAAMFKYILPNLNYLRSIGWQGGQLTEEQAANAWEHRNSDIRNQPITYTIQDTFVVELLTNLM
jgi:hypothetical protein